MSASDDPGSRIGDTLLDEGMEDLYEHAPCGYLSTLIDGTIVKVNQTFIEWTDLSREALLSGTKFQSLLTVGSKIYYETHYAPLVHMQGFANEIALEVVRGDHRILPVLINARQRRDADGTPLFNRITLFDSTDRRRYERELLLARRKAEQIAKDKADLLATLSHDISNPLNALMGVVQLLEGGKLTDQQRRLVRLLKSSSENMLNLLNQVLELSKAESSSFTLVETPFPVRQNIEDVVAAFEPRAREKGVEMRASMDERVPAVAVGDSVALRQILTNLIGNAVKFTQRGSVEVRVETRELSTDAVTLGISVADTGIGIAPEVVGRIFDEFTQASHETAIRFGGTGLGLSIVRKLLALYGSTIHVDGAPGKGSTFSFTLRLPLPRRP